MAITSFVAPATTGTDTIVARLTSDNNLVGVSASDFSLHRADTNAEISARISESKAGNHFWDVTARQTGFSGEAYIEIERNAFRDLQTLQWLPTNPLRSNTFSFVLPAPTNFIVSDGVYTAVLRWDAVRGRVYEIRRDSGAWQDATSPTTITGLSADTEYVFEVRVKSTGAVSNGIATVTKRTLVYPIEDIDEQFIPIGTENYELIIGIVGQHADARVNGLQEGFYQHFENLSDGNSRLYIRNEDVMRLLEKAVWSIKVSDVDWAVTKEVVYNVVPVGPILVDPGRQTMYKGVPFMLLVEVLNDPSVQRGNSELVGLVFGTTTVEDQAYIESVGMLPADANLTFSTFNADYYVENPGGNDTLIVPIDIRDDAVAPTITGLQATYTVQDGAAVNIPFTVTATPEPVVTLDENLPDWLSIEHVSGTNYRIVGTSPGAGSYEFTIVATGLGVVTHDITMTVSPPPQPIAPVIRSISNVSRTSGYSRFTRQASLSAGTQPVTWSISGISGATISDTGLITIPAGLSVSTHTATVTARNSAGADTEQFSVVVSAAAGPPRGDITLSGVAGNRQVALSWNHPSDRGVPVANYNIKRIIRGRPETLTTLVSNYTQTTYTDTTVQNGVTYAYQIEARNASGFRVSNLLNITPNP